jgi:hypothetical protein
LIEKEPGKEMKTKRKVRKVILPRTNKRKDVNMFRHAEIMRQKQKKHE